MTDFIIPFEASISRYTQGVKPLTYYHSSGSDYSSAFTAAMQDIENELYVPPSADPWLISEPIEYVVGKRMSGPQGATIKASASWSGSNSMVNMENGGVALPYCQIEGGLLFDADGKADIGIYAPDAHRCTIRGPRISNVMKKGLVLGGDGVGQYLHGCRVADLEIRLKSGSYAYNAADLKIGVHVTDRAADSWFDNLEIIGFNAGLKNSGGSNDFRGIHPWTTYYYAPMKYGVWTTTSTVISNSYADTPTSLGDGTVGPVYGYFVDAFNVDLIAPRAYLLATDGATPVGINNEATAIYFNVTSVNGCFGNVQGGRVHSSSSAVKWAKDIDSSNWNRALNNLTSLGLQNDGNVITTQGAGSIASPFKTFGIAAVNLAGGGSTNRNGLSLGATFTIATLPTAVGIANTMVMVTDGASSKRLAISDGAVWRYADGTTV